MRKISADIIFPVCDLPLERGLLIVDDNGLILEVLSAEEAEAHENIEYYPGALTPGFINAHCHLELSHLKGKIPTETGLDEFIKQIGKYRQAPSEMIEEAMVNAEKEMLENGIVAVGDISNEAFSFEQKAKRNLYYHTFLEIFGFHPDKAEEAFNIGLYHHLLLSRLALKGDITLHSPYSASHLLLNKICSWAKENKGLLSIHNQENEDENHLYQSKSGAIPFRLSSWGINTANFRPTGKNSLPSLMEFLSPGIKTLLVHNTVTRQEDLQAALDYSNQLWWCFCPRTNLYIENNLPNFRIFSGITNRLLIGTDSLASNFSLDILEEMKVIKKSSAFTFEEILKFATLNGAQFFEIDRDFGSLKKGKKPGINLIQNFDLEKGTITELSSIKKIL